jgi:hypothetical protein
MSTHDPEGLNGLGTGPGEFDPKTDRMLAFVETRLADLYLSSGLMNQTDSETDRIHSEEVRLLMG